MSVSSVHMFYARLASDMMLRNAFAEATAEFTIRFAAERGYMFNGYDLQIAGETFQGNAKRVSEDVRQILEMQKRLGQAAAAAGPKTGAKPTSIAAMPGMQALDELIRALTGIESGRVHDRLGEVFGTHAGAKRQSGGG